MEGANISVVPQFTNAGLTCEGAPELFTIDVLPTPTLSPVNPQVLCNGSATAPIDFVGNATNYAWINNNPTVGLAAAGSGDIAGFNAIAGATNNVANIVITPSYTYNSTTCFGTPVATTITVLPSPYINTVQDVVACNGDLSGVLAFSGTATSFNWNNSNPSIGLAASGTGNLPVFTNTNTSSNPLLATITVTPQTAQGTQTCQGTPEIFTITVNPTPTLNAVNSQLICSQSQSQPVVFAGNASSYSWLKQQYEYWLAIIWQRKYPCIYCAEHRRQYSNCSDSSDTAIHECRSHLYGRTAELLHSALTPYQLYNTAKLGKPSVLVQTALP